MSDRAPDCGNPFCADYPQAQRCRTCQIAYLKQVEDEHAADIIKLVREKEAAVRAAKAETLRAVLDVLHHKPHDEAIDWVLAALRGDQPGGGER